MRSSHGLLRPGRFLWARVLQWSVVFGAALWIPPPTGPLDGAVDQPRQQQRTNDELVRLQVDIIVTLAPQATLAAKSATQTIAIIFVAMGDPLASGVVASLARPAANLTGTTRMIS
jgi:hypothetical protein